MKLRSWNKHNSIVYTYCKCYTETNSIYGTSINLRDVLLEANCSQKVICRLRESCPSSAAYDL